MKKENSPQAFIWRGALPMGLFTGEHSFRFEAVGGLGSEGGEKTLFIQEEKFSGWLGWLMGESLIAWWAGWRQSTRRGFEGFNADLKRWVEEE